MKHITSKIFTIAIFFSIFVSACSIAEGPIGNGDNAGLLEIVAELPSFDIEEKTKADPAVLSDTLFAYSYDSNGSFIDAGSYDTQIGTSYYFSIPEQTSKIIFSTASANDTTYSVTTSSDEITISTLSTIGINKDILYGSINDYSTSNAKSTVALKRAVAKINATLNIFIGDSQITSSKDLGNKSFSMKIHDVYRDVTFTPKSECSYAETDTIDCKFEKNELPDDSFNFNASFYTLPSVTGTIPTLTLTMLDSSTESGNEIHYQVPLPGAIEVNKSYTLDLKLKQDNFTGAFTLSDVVFKEITPNVVVDENGFDLITLSSELISFNNLSDGIKPLVINSRTGVWNAITNEETLKNFEITYNGVGLKADIPVSGNDGDSLMIRPLKDNASGTSAIHGLLTFDAGTPDKFKTSLIQNNGKLQEIELDIQYNEIIIKGTDLNITYRNDGESEWQTYELSDDNKYSASWNRRTFKISATNITEFEILSSTLYNASFSNCISLEKLYYHISNNSTFTELDIKQFPSLRELDYYGCNTSLDFSGLQRLEKATVDNNRSDATKQLTSITFSNNVIRYLNIHHLNSLTTISFDNSKVSTIDSLYINSCPVLTSVNLSSQKVNMVDVMNSSSINTFRADNSTIQTVKLNMTTGLLNLNLKDCPLLDTLIIDAANNLNRFQLENSNNIRYYKLGATSANENLPSSATDISTLSKLEYLSLYYINTPSLNLSNNTVLKDLTITLCNQLTTLECDGLPLEKVYISDCNAMLNLILRNLENLKDLTIQDGINSIVLDNCPLIESLNLDDSYTSNKIKAVSFNNMPSVKKIFLNTSSLNTFNMNVAPALESIVIQNAEITYLSIPSGNQLSSVKLNSCNYLQPGNIHLNAKSTLEDFEISYGGTSTNDSDVYMDLSGYSKLNRISLDHSRVHRLNITDCSLLMKLDLCGCNFDATALNYIFTNLPVRDPDAEELAYIRISSTPGESECDRTIATDTKGWYITSNNL